MTEPIKKNRLVFVDQTRALAIAMMLVGHSLDRFLGEPWRSSAAYEHYQFVRGLSSALFLFIAGFSFVIASFGRVEEFTRLSDRMKARLRRVGLILFLGILLQLPAPTLRGALAISEPEAWERLFSFNVLPNIGLGLLFLHGLLFVFRAPRRFGLAVLALACVVFLLAPVTYRPEVDAALPVWLRGAVNLYHQSRFPLIPYTAFIFMGAVLGSLYWTHRGTAETRVFAVAAVAGALLVGFEVLIREAIPGGVFPYSTGQPKTAGNTFARAGCAVLITTALFALSRRRVVLPRLSFLLSKDSLAIYFTHLFLVYGGAASGGLFASRVESMSPWQAALFILCLFGTMTAMALVLKTTREHYPALLATLRRGLVLCILLCFLLLPRLVWYSVAAVAVLSAVMIFVFKRARMRMRALSAQ